ncbi:peroxisomal membrane protein PEX16 [Hyalella azteca]|uniref:Peroxisomal membrane protein PEX16 n=1 Tax=Hyalella azteca TaxID=294128 RepID=A0A8B7P666_HYAAZ|nr:peroxisomal membrane protein PEX16 [Hyalella azteca]
MSVCSEPVGGLAKLQALFEQYKKWIVSHPQNLSDMEAVVRWGSYLLAGRFQHSSLLCELLSSGSRLFELFNDMLLHCQLPKFSLQQEKKIQFLLCVLEGVEVVVEVGAQQLWGEFGRWAVVATVQLIKLIWRFILMFRNKLTVLPCTSESPIDRACCLKLLSNNNSAGVAGDGQGTSAATFLDQHRKPNETKLPHSGQVLRAVHSLPPPHLRTYVVTQRSTPQLRHATSSPRSKRQLAAEMLYVLRPLSHLSCSYFFGRRSWKPYLVALSMDISSLELHRRSALLTPQQRAEVLRRYRNVLLYLLRSPAYQQITRRRLETFLNSVGSTVPFTGRLCQSLVQYVAYWQDVYGHCWSA